MMKIILDDICAYLLRIFIVKADLQSKTLFFLKIEFSNAIVIIIVFFYLTTNQMQIGIKRRSSNDRRAKFEPVSSAGFS